VGEEGRIRERERLVGVKTGNSRNSVLLGGGGEEYWEAEK